MILNINVGNISKPVTTFIEVITNAISGGVKPWQMKRIARAEADVNLILAKGKIEKQELVQRSLSRFVAEETRKQINIESIVQKAIPQIKDSARPEDMDVDWIFDMFDKCKFISDEHMQHLWAKILAGEANTPGTFSRRTINLLTFLGKKEAQMFTNILSFCWVIANDPNLLIYNLDDSIYKQPALQFSKIRVSAL